MIARKHVFYLFMVVFGVLYLTSCSNTKYLTEDEQLLIKNEVHIVENEEATDVPKSLKSFLGGLANPKSNKTFIGTRLPQWIYNQGNPDKEGNLSYKIGSKPELVDAVRIENSSINMTNYLENKGYFNAKVAADVVPIKEKMATVKYNVDLANRRYFGGIDLSIADSAIYEIVEDINIAKKIVKDQPYDALALVSTRTDIVNTLLEKGYYNVDSRVVGVIVDTLENEKYANVEFEINEDIIENYNKTYYIDNVDVIIQHAGLNNRKDSAYYNDKKYYLNDIIKLKPEALDKFIYIEKGNLFKKSLEAQTIDKLYDLRIVQYAKIEYSKNDDTGLLDARITVNTNSQRELTFEPEISEASGISLSGTAAYTNKNIFKGGDVFSLEGSGGVQAGETGLSDTWFLRAAANLEMPRLVGVPKANKKWNEKIINGRTIARGGVRLQDNSRLYKFQEYTLGQQWRWATSPQNQHYFSLIDITYFRPFSFTPEFTALIEEYPSIGNAYEPRLILGGNYAYEYSSSKTPNQRKYLSFRGDVDYSGNVASLFANDNKLFDRELSRYVRVEINFVQHYPVGERSELVFRANPAFAKSLGDGRQIPAIKQFTLGGPNSMRAWVQRSLGPGNYNIFNDPNIPTPEVLDQRGNLKLETNLEYRFPMGKLFGLDLGGALFTDVGNIWNTEEDDLNARPGATFDNLFDDVAVATGGGVRLDIQNFLLLRLDVGFKLVDPLLPEGDRMPDTPFDLQNGSIQFGIGMPFN